MWAGDAASRALGMEIVDVAAGTRDAADDGARGHGQRARDRARRLHVHAGRLGVRVRLQLLQPQHGRGRRARSGSSRPTRLGDVLVAEAVERSREGRDGVYDITRARPARPWSRSSSAAARRSAGRSSTTRRIATDRPEVRMPDYDAEELRALQLERPARDARAGLRARAALPPRVRRRRRDARRPARRWPTWPGSRSPPRRTCGRTTRSACSRCRASRSAACTPPPVRRASRPSWATPPRTSTTWAEVMARSIHAAGGRPGRRRARGLRLRAVHRRARRALRRRAARLHGRPGLRRHDPAAGAADRATSSRG